MDMDKWRLEDKQEHKQTERRYLTYAKKKEKKKKGDNSEMRLDLARQLYKENAAYLVKPIVYDHSGFFYLTCLRQHL